MQGKAKWRAFSGRLAIAFAGCLAASLTALNGLSNGLRGSDPALAARLAPYNTEARRQDLLATLRDRQAERPAGEQVDAAARLARLAPVDGQAISLLAEAFLREGRKEDAERANAVALALVPTDLLGLSLRIGFDLAAADLDAAADRLVLVARRWPAQFANLDGLLDAMLANDVGYPALVARMREEPALKRIVLNTALTKTNPNLVYRLVLDLGTIASGLEEAQVARAARLLLQAREWKAASQLFALTLSPADRERAGYLHDPLLQGGGSTRPFDWNVSRQAGIDTNFLDQDGGGLSLTFASKPIGLTGVAQTLRLPPGRYRFLTRVATTDLKAPRGLFWVLDCALPRRSVFMLPLPTGTSREQAIEQDFTVDPDCQGLTLVLRTEARSQSFQHAMRGRLVIREARITRAGS